ncbi:hydrolase [Roseivirga sp. 4D4]|uniref:alpha/beta hydrolase n=1 Tax=Roseivirga sp. 4D4 TaxID=1889784 RepID=UPI000852DA16|nr:alpha/beta fold hydrolase [Roseivirga sp. 4D4]OEK01877.1 hydrolase [Roseivirga sp. 4D4]
MEIGTILIIVGIAYVVANFVIYFAQERFLFKPEKLPEDFEFKYPNLQFEEYNLEKEPGVNINGIHFRIAEPKGVVIYLKGNSKSLKGWGKFAVDFTRLGYDVLMVDYRGFGKSTGKRSEESIKDDLQYVYDKVREQVPEKYIILYGRSLGSGFAAKIASINHPRMLVLESPYYSLAKVTKRYIPFMPVSLLIKFPIRTYKWLKYVDCPIKIVHGTNDKLIPFKTAVSLSKVNAENTRLYPVIGAGHNNLHTFEEYHRMLEEILNSKLPGTIDPSETSLNFKRKRKKERQNP